MIVTVLRRTAMAIVAALLLLYGVAPAIAAENATLLRVFLTDGTTVVSYGEYARIGDRVVFSMPVGTQGDDLRLHVVDLPANIVDWASTSNYAESARFQHYAATRAESDYAALTGDIAATLNAIVLASDASTRLQLALQARRTLADWPQAHYGYRAADVRQILGLLDEMVSELRAAAGGSRFDFDLVVTVEPPPTMPILPDPTAAESIDQALSVARLADVPAQRLSLLNAVVRAIDDEGNALPLDWAKRTRAEAMRTIAAELKTERDYTLLSTEVLGKAAAAAGRADVRVVESVIETLQRRDAQLGRKRPEQVSALIGMVQAHLDAARRLRLVRDQWTAHISAYRAYNTGVTTVLRLLSREQSSLDDIKRLAGPEPAVLERLSEGFIWSAKALAAIQPPPELHPAHALLASAVNLAENAVNGRRAAIGSGNYKTALDASAAAAGSMMLFARARADLEAFLKLPQLR